jgi:predicted nucleic acid-binding protein
MNSLPGGEYDEAPERRRIAVDACVLINLLRLGRLDILEESALLLTVVTKSVLDEITDKGQHDELESSIAAGRMNSFDPVDPAAVGVFMAAIERGLGRGEASCMAFCETSDALLGCDEKAKCFMKVVEGSGLSDRLVTTRDLINLAVQDGRLTLGAANRLLGDLRTRFRYSSDDLQSGEDLPPAFEKFGSGLR